MNSMTRRISVFLLGGLMAMPFVPRGGAQTAPRPAVIYRTLTVQNVPLKVIDVDLNAPGVYVTVQTAKGFPNGAEPFGQMLKRSHPVAAMNGSYFSKDNLCPIGDVCVRGERLLDGWIKSGLVIDKDGKAEVRRTDPVHPVDPSQIETLLACSPVLVRNGRIDYRDDMSNHRDLHVLGRCPRMGVGVTTDNHLLLVASGGRISFGEWAVVMQKLGCRDALNLDSGASRAMYFNGKTLLSPGRPLTNLLVVYQNGKPPLDQMLAPGTVSPEPPPLPENIAASDAVPVRICADSVGKANAYCPVTVVRRLTKARLPKPCRLHRAR
jgi:hypothetical protein